MVKELREATSRDTARSRLAAIGLIVRIARHPIVVKGLERDQHFPMQVPRILRRTMLALEKPGDEL